jgi:cobalt-zinc-cadmium efflux system outer membrane protein
MSYRTLLAGLSVLLVSGCLYHAREHTDATVAQLVGHPYDIAPNEPAQAQPQPDTAPTLTKFAPVRDERSQIEPTSKIDVQTTAYMEEAAQLPQATTSKPKLEPKIPPEIPGSEAGPMKLPPVAQEQARQRAIQQLFPPLPPLPTEPAAVAGPEGRPYTLADLQQLAAAHSPELRQSASDVEAARGNLIQARAYPNPTVGWNVTPSNDGSTSAAQGPFVDQLIKTGGKLKLASASAEMDLRNAELALRRARSDLVTRVRNAYYALLVAKETVRVNRALADFTDQIYRLHTGLLEAGSVAAYEPMALRGQTYTARLAHKQAIQTYLYSWKQLVTTLGLRQMPLSQVQGRIDALIPLYEYDKVLGHMLRNHTDVLTARNGLDKARYQLKLQQITPLPDVDVNVGIIQEMALAPKQMTPTATIGLPLFPIWDQNKGNIMAAEGALIRATEEPHRVEDNLTILLATAYMSYKTNVDGLEFYRHHILPDQVRAYRGVLERRQIDSNVAFSDLFGAQQTLAGDVTTYLGILGTLWSSVVSVADLLQTDDLFQLAEPRAIPELPDLEHLTPWPCCHPGVGVSMAAPSVMQPVSQTVPQSTLPALPRPDFQSGAPAATSAGSAVASFAAQNAVASPAPTEVPAANPFGQAPSRADILQLDQPRSLESQTLPSQPRVEQTPAPQPAPSSIEASRPGG